ncbi:hypothetical protein QVD17_26793 [Tagetes erecta]|uniref:Uncharacterized protein n=1 Tax=Tagetes erecta TaxID=13708 RepID=A0AAD8NR53_TARER|nr:hypothetical protein QVD17_26793 [Tagetes erecta]
MVRLSGKDISSSTPVPIPYKGQCHSQINSQWPPSNSTRFAPCHMKIQKHQSHFWCFDNTSPQSLHLE